MNMNMNMGSVSADEAQVFQFLSDIQHLAETRRFKAWFLDQFGVLHDGKKPYPGVISTCNTPDHHLVAGGSLMALNRLSTVPTNHHGSILAHFGLTHAHPGNFPGGHPSLDYSQSNLFNCGVLLDRKPEKKVHFGALIPFCNTPDHHLVAGGSLMALNRLSTVPTNHHGSFLAHFGLTHAHPGNFPGGHPSLDYSQSDLFNFGVLLDRKPEKKVQFGVENLAKTGAKMVIISNSSRRASMTTDKMKSMGFDPSLFLACITSGELTHLYLQRRDDAWFAKLGRSCIHITWRDPGAISLDGLDLKVVDNVEEADFILAHVTVALGHSSGSVVPKTLEELEKILEECAVRKIPMVVANPDFVTVEASSPQVMPGTLAAKYEKLGEEVKCMGKPGKVIYESAMALAGVDASECIAVGDSLHHDIKGANIAGMQSIFLPGGIHATELGLHNFDDLVEEHKVRDLASKCDAYPTYVVPSFTW